MIHYIIQILLFQTLFLAIYDLFLKKETFFQWNRAYLIISSVLAYIIPFINIKSVNTYVQQDLAFELPIINLTNGTTYLDEVVIGNAAQTVQLTNIELIYLIGIVITSLLFIIKIFQIYRRITTNKVIIKKDYKLVLLEKQTTAFSFFTYLFLGKTIYKQEHQHIIEHELIHIKQKHSLDLIFFEIQKIIFWMNPFSYLFQNRISALHEYIADAKAIKENPKKQFFENLLNQNFQVEKFSFVNQFYKKSLIKKRIIMATKNKSKEILKLKYLLVLPIVAIMLTFTSIFAINNNENNIKYRIDNLNTNYKKDTISPIKNQSNIHLGNLPRKKMSTYKGEKVYFPIKIDEPTHFEKRISKNNDLGFISDLILFTQNNIDKEKMKTFNSSDKGAGVTFIINKKGGIEAIDVSSIKSKEIKDYAINMIKKLPKIVPGKHEGKPVYTRGFIYIYNPNYERVKLSYNKVDQKPIYPGCEDVVDKDKCFQQGISKFIVDNFDNKMVNSLGLPNGMVRIVAQFSFNEYGNTLDVKVRAPHPKIIDHVKSIISKIPQVTPAKHNGENVVVKYMLPIKISIESSTTTIIQNEITQIEEVIETEIVPFSVIDQIPVYPGCKGNKHELKKCMADKISMHIAKKFNIDLAQKLGLSVGKKRISVQFNIDKNGNIADVKARAPHPKLQSEAIRIIKLLPQMKPGIQDGKAVNVRYNLPIVFNVESNTNDEKSENQQIKNNIEESITEEIREDVPFSVIDKSPIYPGCDNNIDKRRCFSTNVTEQVSKQFNVKIAQNLGLTPGKKRISVQFKIDHNGFITNIRARAPHPKLQQEAVRVIKTLPRMTPGQQNGKAVNVRYNLPIVFNVEK